MLKDAELGSKGRKNEQGDVSKFKESKDRMHLANEQEQQRLEQHSKPNDVLEKIAANSNPQVLRQRVAKEAKAENDD